MDYIEMVHQIMAAEQGAKALAEEAREHRERMQADWERDISAMRENYLERARNRLEAVQHTEQRAEQEALEKLDQRLDNMMRAVESSYEKNKERWVDILFSMIVGVQP